MFFRAVGVLVFALGSVKCAIHLFDFPSRWSHSLTTLEALDPRNQAAGSSYTIIENSKGSREPPVLTNTKVQNKPEGQYSEHRRVNKVKHNRQLDPREYTEFDDDTSSEVTSQRAVSVRPSPAESRERKVTQVPSSSASPPKSINEIVEKAAPLEGAGSSKSGKYLGGGGIGDGFEKGHDQEVHYDKEGGKKFVEAHKEEGGEKAHKAHKEQEAYEKAEKALHDKEAKKDFASEKSGKKEGHLDEEKHKAEEHKKKDGEKIYSVSSLGGHEKSRTKKGRKKVHNLVDEAYTEEFIDTGHDKQDKEEGLHEHEAHEKERGGAAKKGSHDSAYHEGHRERDYLDDKAHHEEEQAGRKKEAAEQEHHDEHSEYGKKGGHKGGGKYGHAEKGGHDGGYFGRDGGF